MVSVKVENGQLKVEAQELITRTVFEALEIRAWEAVKRYHHEGDTSTEDKIVELAYQVAALKLMVTDLTRDKERLAQQRDRTIGKHEVCELVMEATGLTWEKARAWMIEHEAIEAHELAEH